VSVLGVDPGSERARLKGRIGIVLQSTGIDRYLTVRETIAMYATFYAHPRPVDEVIHLVGFDDKAGARVSKLSGGQQRRLDVAIALVANPELLFLDEPTTGFDPSARREAWGVFKNLATLGMTVLLTTHYMDEAQFLADRVAVIVGGRIVAEGPPATLGGRDVAKARIRYRPAVGAAFPRELSGSRGPDGYTEMTPDDVVKTLHDLTGWAMDHGASLDGDAVVAGGRVSLAHGSPVGRQRPIRTAHGSGSPYRMSASTPPRRTPPCSKATASAPASAGPATAGTTPSPRASSPRSSSTCCTATAGRPVPLRGARSLSTSRSSPTASAAIRRSVTSVRQTTNPPTPLRIRANKRVR
jgi:energy-coupling factor transporter ATP-binding protein EcfA2